MPIKIGTSKGYRPSSKDSDYPTGQGFYRSQEMLNRYDDTSVDTRSSRSRSKLEKGGWDDEEAPKTPTRFGLRRRPATGNDVVKTKKSKRFSALGDFNSNSARSDGVNSVKKFETALEGRSAWDPESAPATDKPSLPLTHNPSVSSPWQQIKSGRPKTGDSAHSATSPMPRASTSSNPYFAPASQYTNALTSSLESLHNQHVSPFCQDVPGSTPLYFGEVRRRPLADEAMSRGRRTDSSTLSRPTTATGLVPSPPRLSFNIPSALPLESEIMPAVDYHVTVAPNFEEEAGHEQTASKARPPNVRVSTLPTVREMRKHCRAFEDLLRDTEDVPKIPEKFAKGAVRSKSFLDDLGSPSISNVLLSAPAETIGQANEPNDAETSFIPHFQFANVGIRRSKDLQSPVAVPRSPTVPSWDEGASPFIHDIVRKRIGEKGDSTDSAQESGQLCEPQRSRVSLKDPAVSAKGSEEAHDSNDTVRRTELERCDTFDIPLHLPVTQSRDNADNSAPDSTSIYSSQSDPSESLIETFGMGQSSPGVGSRSVPSTAEPLRDTTRLEVSKELPSRLGQLSLDETVESELENDAEIQFLQKRAITQRRGNPALRLNRAVLLPQPPPKHPMRTISPGRSPGTLTQDEPMTRSFGAPQDGCALKDESVQRSIDSYEGSRVTDLSLSIADDFTLSSETSISEASVRLDWKISGRHDDLKEKIASFADGSSSLSGTTTLSPALVEAIARVWLRRQHALQDPADSAPSALLPIDTRHAARQSAGLSESDRKKSVPGDERAMNFEELKSAAPADILTLRQPRSLSSLSATSAIVTSLTPPTSASSASIKVRGADATRSRRLQASF